MNTDSNSLVMIDPSARSGESALDLIELGERVTLFVMLSGPSASALEEFARIEGVSVSEAGDIYLEQVKGRLRDSGALVSGLSASGDYPIEEILEAVAATGAARVALPAGTKAFGRKGLNDLVTASPVPVVIAPAA
jgi:hypothetical protein